MASSPARGQVGGLPPGGGTVHIIGAGLAGLSAAVRLVGAGRSAVVHEAARHAGGRCRSYFEPALGLRIDNGNHLVLSGNRAAFSYLDAIGAADKLEGPAHAEFPFANVATGERWTLRINDGRLPWWIFAKARRVPGSRAGEYLALAKLLAARPGQTIADVIGAHGPLYDRLWQPVLLSALNTNPKEACAVLAGAVVRESLALGGKACRPMVAAEGLATAFVDPALAYLESKGAPVRFGSRLRKLVFGADGACVAALDMGEDGEIALGPQDRVILAVPPQVARGMVPDLTAPDAFRAIVNAHYKLAASELPAPGMPPLQGVVGGVVEWLFAFPDRLSVTISAGDRLLETPREELARLIWREVAALAGLSAEAMPPWQIVREVRATFAATPEQEKLRPPAATRWPNLTLAGDWTATGLPATIEGAIRSGHKAADLVLGRAG